MTTDTPQPVIVRLTLDVQITDPAALLRYVERLHTQRWVGGFAEANPDATIADAAMEGLVLLHRDPRDGGTAILHRSARVWTGEALPFDDAPAPDDTGEEAAALAELDAYLVAQKDTSIPRKD